MATTPRQRIAIPPTAPPTMAPILGPALEGLSTLDVVDVDVADVDVADASKVCEELVDDCDASTSSDVV